MMSVVFFCLINILDGKSDLIFVISIFSDRKENLVGTLRKSKFKIPSSFRKHQEKQKKNGKL